MASERGNLNPSTYNGLSSKRFFSLWGHQETLCCFSTTVPSMHKARFIKRGFTVCSEAFISWVEMLNKQTWMRGSDFDILLANAAQNTMYTNIKYICKTSYKTFVYV